MEGVLDRRSSIDVKENSVTANGERIPTKSSSLPVRKSLSDITNLQQQQQSFTQDENPSLVSCTPKDYIEKLHKENATLLRLLAEKNKIIELSSLELQKLRFNLQKMSQQNWQLAQANSNMLAELNLDKDKLKGLRHELGCKTALLKVKHFELEERKKPRLKIGIKDEPAGCEEMTEAAKGEINSNRRRQSRRTSFSNQSLNQQAAVKEKVDNKRICLRRRSSTSRSDQLPPTEDLFEIEDAKFPVRPLSDSVQEDCLTQLLDSSFPNSDGKSIVEKVMRDNSPQHRQAQEPRRSSLGRPLRRAAVKVSSYKEVPINVKMRRSE